MHYGKGNPLYDASFIDKVNDLRNHEDFIYLTRTGIKINIGISNRTFYEWLENHKEFKDAVEDLLRDVEYAHQMLATKKVMNGEKMGSVAWLIHRSVNVFKWRSSKPEEDDNKDSAEREEIRAASEAAKAVEKEAK